MQFGDVIGQSAIKNQLIRSVREKRVSHALLLTGRSGSGHFPLALAFAQYLQCSNPGEDDSCSECPSCRQSAKFAHPDIHFVFPVARVKGIKVEEDSKSRQKDKEPYSDLFLDTWRFFLAEHPYPSLKAWYQAIGIENQQPGIFRRESSEILYKLGLKAFESEYKVVVFWMPEKMNVATANKLLKIIEEPPAKTVFLFVSDNPEDLLPTILSRTQQIKVPGIAGKDLQARLEIDFPGQKEALPELVRRVQGDYLVALEQIRMDEQIGKYREFFIDWMRTCYSIKANPVLTLSRNFSDMGREKQKAFFEYVIRTLRSHFMQNRKSPELAYLDPVESEFSTRFHPFIHPGNIGGMVSLFQTAIRHVGMNANPRILFTDLSFKMHDQLRQKP